MPITHPKCLKHFKKYGCLNTGKSLVICTIVVTSYMRTGSKSMAIVFDLHRLILLNTAIT